ncbi:NADH dehydrogenase [ubiquinone] 1 beta subcomplex subunit 6 [Colossoma macropomum]|uniref:NADH dehydrogenase [ubiquinone] 1 beta subcomplex subunit 6 n=1 Tax=Colossoma macropomum TaxID=42526 RepID=UPI001865340C|nr:NADH dehydrogenase [ubiquinone] 1 beta subcomplex subunit 6 [Colossoma macropomum]XP_036430673.1 NADH dehydrogenase [ubiquinone] 1 beta subcomplex subunit 6 [Colossoma macropomum]
MSGYSADERLRAQQLWNLRRRWLKDQELSPREPVTNGATHTAVQQKGWTFRAYRAGTFALTRILIPAWIVHYYMKYHVTKMPYGIVELKPRLFPGDTVLETGEVIPDLPEAGGHGHH